MTLDEAIKKHYEEATRQKSIANGAEYLGVSRESIEHCRECAADHRQLAEWLTELKEAKRLLKLAVDDIKNAMTSYDHCNICALTDNSRNCPVENDADCMKKCKWCHADEVLKLIGND